MDIGDAGMLGFDADRLKRIPAFLEEKYLSGGRFPHAQIMLSREGKTALFSTHGDARADGTPLGDDALFRIASMTKPVTSVAFMMLVEEGRVALDDPVEKVLPELAALTVCKGGGAGVPFLTGPPDAPIRMVDLLRHTSGFTYGFQQRGNVDAAYRSAKLDDFHSTLDADGFIRELAALPLEFSPGEAWNYSVSTDVLGIIVERLSGMTLGAFFAQRIFGPLAMEDSFFTVPEDRLHRLADAWYLHPRHGRVIYDRADDSLWGRARPLQSGGGGLVSTASDYHRFALMLLNGGELDGARLLSPKTVELMTMNHLPGGADLAHMSRSLFSEAQNAGAGFGLGFGITIDPVRTMLPGSVGEFYWGGMFSTFFFVDPLEKIVMIFMTQLMPSSSYPVRRELKTLIYSALTRSYA